MAASMVRCIAPNSSKLIKRLVLSGSNGRQIRTCSSVQTDTDITEENISEEDRALEDSLFRIRDVSRLGPHLKRQLRKERTDLDRDYKLTREYSRKLYGKLGSASGVNPQILWPNLEELRAKIEYDKQFEPTFKRNMKKVLMWEERREKKLNMRLENVDKAMAKMPKLIKQFHLKIETAEKEAIAEKEKLAQLNREAVELYGPMKKGDHRLKEFISTRLREERKKEREAKVEKKKAKKLKTLTEEKITAEENN